MDRRAAQLEYLQQPSLQSSHAAISIFYALTILYLVLVYFKYPIPPLHTLLYDSVVYLVPQRLLLSGAQTQELDTTGMLSSTTHAAKKEALAGMLGLGGATLLSKLPSGASESIGVMRRASTSMFSRPQLRSDAPPGLGNWDNSCYQNCVLQGLSSLESLKSYLERLESGEDSTSGTLLATVNNLNDSSNNGRQLWTPAKLKNMSSWQQQDAQEYYSKVLDLIDKEAIKAFSSLHKSSKPGLESLASDDTQLSTPAKTTEGNLDDHKSPLDGLLAQRVTCTRCGFSEGLSMIPFNCLTLPLASNIDATTVQECLDEYTNLEEIPQVECAKCTLVHANEQLKKRLPANPSFQSTEEEPSANVDPKIVHLPPELRAQAFKRLAAIQKALEEDDFADKTLNESCEISKKARVSSTKTRQAVIARPPRCLVVHVNRSVFDEMTGYQRKNYARVQFPLGLDMTPWMLNEADQSSVDGGQGARYRLKAVVTHYGRHENGHYICYRQHPVRRKVSEDVDDDVEMESVDEVVGKHDPWYRLSDEDVSHVEEEDVLAQGGVFMLFYERDSMPAIPAAAYDSTAAEPQPSRVTPDSTLHESDDTNLTAIDFPHAHDETMDIEDSSATESSITADFSAASSPLQASTEATTDDECAADPLNQDDLRKGSSSSPLLMRTARIPVVESEFGGTTFRAVAAT